MISAPKINKIRLGDCIELVKIKCGVSNLTVNDVSGINKDKEFFEPTKQVGNDTSDYKIVPPDCFACNLMHIGRDVVLPISINRTKKNKIVSGAYHVFKFIDESKLLKDYFFIFLKSSEKDRYFWFHCDSSVRDGMDWDVFCNIEIEVPSIDIQRKYVAIYESLIENLRCYENGLNDLRTVYEGYFDILKKQNNKAILCDFIKEVATRNDEKRIHRVFGVNSTGEFGQTKANMFGIDISKYKIVKKGQFAYNPSRINLGSIAMLQDSECVVSPMYIVFETVNNIKLDPVYLNIWLQRKEFLRSTFFYSIGSVRDTFDFDLMQKVMVPLPPIETQKAIVNIFNTIRARKSIFLKIKNLINNVCPVLIRGSILEANGEKQNAN